MIRLKDPVEIKEIREEERDMIARLDVLVEEFMKEMDELAMPLPEFIRTRWPERMYAELSARDEMSEAHQRAMADPGAVILEDQPEELIVEVSGDSLDDEYNEWIQGLEASLK